MSSGEDISCKLSFKTLITNYQKTQSTVLRNVRQLAENMCTATPGKFLLVQFQMSQVTQIGDSISNLISQVNSMINNAVRNQKTQ
jgi:hypothetical protein